MLFVPSSQEPPPPASRPCQALCLFVALERARHHQVPASRARPVINIYFPPTSNWLTDGQARGLVRMRHPVHTQALASHQASGARRVFKFCLWLSRRRRETKKKRKLQILAGIETISARARELKFRVCSLARFEMQIARIRGVRARAFACERATTTARVLVYLLELVLYKTKARAEADARQKVSRVARLNE